MILVDANLLIYAIDADSPHHAVARPWLEEVLSSTTRVGLAWIVTLAFLRITTHSSIFRRPLTPEAAMAFVDSWFSQPFVEPVAPGPEHWSIFRRLVTATGTTGNLASDAHLAALAIEHGYTIYSADSDFKRFPGLRYVNPLVPR